MLMYMRLFVAVQPSPDVLDHLETALTAVGGGLAGPWLRWTPPDHRHITLAFYGEVPEGYLDDLAGALDDAALAQPRFDAAVRGAGLFSGRTLWVGCSGDGWGPLMTAAGQIGADLLGRQPDGRSRPHLTVARVGDRARASSGSGAVGRPRTTRAARASTDSVGADVPASLARALALYTGPTWTVGEIVLVRSQLGSGPSGAPRYDVVHRSPLHRWP
jgi:RNA 2',3'-cyclic 3'-phosphodiesterase